MRPVTVVIGLIFVVLSLLALGIGAWQVVERKAERAVAGRPPTAAERAKGVVRGVATFEAVDPIPVPPCHATWKVGKQRRSVSFNGDNRVRFEDGEEYLLPDAQKITFFDDGPDDESFVPAEAKAYLSKINLGVSRFESVACLTPQQKVWVEACVKGNHLVGCEKREDPILITVEGRTYRARFVTSHAHGGIALVLVGLVALTLGLGVVLGHDRKVVASLAELRGVDVDLGKHGALLALAGVGFVAGLVAWNTAYGPWIGCVFAVLVALFACSLAAARLRVLGATRKVLVETATTRLWGDAAPMRELAVHVAPDAPTVEGFRVGERHAVVQFEITESYADPNHTKKLITTRQIARGVHPRTVPIVDASGRGTLSFEHCTLDVPEEPGQTWNDGMPQSPSWLAEVTGPLLRSETHREYGVRWRVLQPGEPLLIYGGVERVLPPPQMAMTAAGYADPGGYRVAPEVPLVRGQPNAKAVAYVGTEAELLHAIQVERRARLASLLLIPPAVVAAIVAGVWVVL